MTRYSKEWDGLTPDQRATIKMHQTIPPVPVGAVAKSLGLSVKVATLPADVSGEIRRVSTAESVAGFQIRINRHEDKRRQRFTLAHEIAHYLLHADLIKDSLSDDVLYRSSLSNRREAEANRLASDILMPQSLIEQISNEFPGQSREALAVKLAHILEVSEIAMKIKLGAAAENK